ncbi:alpha/beta hydrolase [Aspergillus melleus]|uniref:alpha/beta hydrolase n=1 Tax=Aspergillus melleus TaxID=138277 RepID=UPI001E8DD216|nr:uncharacterized protein LDX57_008273 [Aspergillus melleus]KAH8430610.1 hypothetical protein LDX57_008273 [Aspergillus melleus]
MGQLLEKKLIYLVNLFTIVASAIIPSSGQPFEDAVSLMDSPVLELRSETSSFEWESITPTPHLVYHPCFENYQCARLELPMDWNRADQNGSKIALAVIRLPAKVPVTDARYGGPVILNPGGPGNSGVQQVLTEGKLMQGIVDPESTDLSSVYHTAAGKYFDIISFDPRGINNTTPPFTCFQNSASRKKWQDQATAEGMLGSSEIAFDLSWSRNAALSMICSQAYEDVVSKGEEWLGLHMNTPTVVADMVGLIERHGEWRERETETLLQSAQKTPENEAIRRQNRWKQGEEKLLYWGLSYGTVLGMTFAAMHPDRIQRAVIDGVCDGQDYYSGNWLKNIQDADEVYKSFFEYCHEAGPTKCALAGDSAEEIKARIDELIERLKTNPVPALASANRPPDMITYTDVKNMITNALYEPMDEFETMAQLLADLLRNNGSSFADFKYQGAEETCPGTVVPGDNKYEAQASIVCTDGENIDGITKDKYRRYWQTLQRQSKTIGDTWAMVRLPCIKWKTQPAWRFDGPIAGNTSHPLLFVGNTYDPVTPLRNAVRMSRQFPRSVVLQQDSLGHCSTSAPSSCSYEMIRRYFQTGDLPEPGTICEVDQRPFGLPPV